MNPQLVRRTKLHGVPLGIMVLKSFAKEAMDKEFPGLVDIDPVQRPVDSRKFKIQFTGVPVFPPVRGTYQDIDEDMKL